MALKVCPNCRNKVSSTKVICPHCGHRINQSENQNGGMLFALALVLALIFAPIIIVLGLHGRFLLKGLFKNVLQIEEFKEFRKKYSIICLSWFAAGIVLTVLMVTLIPDLAQYCLYPLVIGNIVLFALSIKYGNKIYKKHQDDIPADSDASGEDVTSDEPVDNEYCNGKKKNELLAGLAAHVFGNKFFNNQKDKTPADSDVSGEDVTNYEPVDIEDSATDTAIDEPAGDSPRAVGSNEYYNKKKMFELLTELAALRDANILTEEEFNEQKRQILSSHYESMPQQVTSEKVTVKEVALAVSDTTVSKKKAVEKKESHHWVVKLINIVNLILTSLSVVAFIVGAVFLCTARIRVFREYYSDGTSHLITSNYIAAAFDGWDISILCLFTIIGAILMLIALSAKLTAEIKHSQDDNKTIITDILTILVSAIPIVFSALTVDYYENVGLLLFLILSASCAILVAMHLVLLLIKKLACDSEK